MFRPSVSERLIHTFDMKTRNFFSGKRRKKLNNTDFTIISNNCWGGGGV